MPTRRPSVSTTGRPLILCESISFAASSIVVCGETLITGEVMTVSARMAASPWMLGAQALSWRGRLVRYPVAGEAAVAVARPAS